MWGRTVGTWEGATRYRRTVDAASAARPQFDPWWLPAQPSQFYALKAYITRPQSPLTGLRHAHARAATALLATSQDWHLDPRIALRHRTGFRRHPATALLA